LDRFPEKTRIRVLPSQDGSVFYGYEEKGIVIPVTDPVAPIQRIQGQLDQHVTQLADTTRPVLIVGLYPGNELLSIFDRCDRITTPHCPQPILVCVDSMICLYGFLQAWDARRILRSSRVRLFWHGDLQREVECLRQHPEKPHVFTLISSAPDKTLDSILPPLAALIQERERETLRLCADNNDYYERMDDRQLAAIIKGRSGRKPRLMMPTCTWSTFIQHSARDTCAAFEDIGWETNILKMDAMLTPYYLVRSIHEFKPDVFLFIDHLRYEAEEVYPRHMMFLTWIQDEMSHIQCEEAGRKLTEYAAGGKRDLVVGYVDQLDTKYGYPKDRLVPLHIPADPRIFHPTILTEVKMAKYGCELSFITNVSMSSEQVVEEKILPIVEPLGISRATVQAIHDHLWNEYRSDKTFVDRDQFLAELLKFDEFSALWETLRVRNHKEAQEKDAPSLKARISNFSPQGDDLFRLFYVRLNDTMYRHVVLEWADELGVNLHLYGQGWENHPRFAKYARGPLAHDTELNIAYQCARWNLHLNITQGMHQRLWEILAAGARPLVRAPSRLAKEPSELSAGLRRLAAQLREFGEGSPEAFRLDDSYDSAELRALMDFIFEIAWSQTTGKSETVAGEFVPPLEERVGQILINLVSDRMDCQIPDWNFRHFTNRESFAGIMRQKRA
jgi:hypothetical protein